MVDAKKTPAVNYIKCSMLVITVVVLKVVNDLATAFHFIFTERKMFVPSETVN